MEKQIQHLQINNTIIIVFANNCYLPVLNNWLYAIERLGITNYLIIALDEVLLAHLQSRHVPVLLRPCDPVLESLWIHRIAVIQEILMTGYDVLHSDADAVWLKDPLQKYIYAQPYDMIFSQGTVWPPDVHKVWHFVLCCGFFFIKANASTLRFMAELSERVIKDKDDQVSVNRLLLERTMQWQNKKGYALNYQDKDINCFHEVLAGNGGGLRVALLPHAGFQRLNDCEDEVYVKHILSAKKTANILQVLQENNCLFTDPKD